MIIIFSIILIYSRNCSIDKNWLSGFRTIQIISESLYVAEFLFFDTFLMHFLFQTVLFFFSVQLDWNDWNVRISSKNYESLSHSINKWIRFNTAIWVVVLLKLVKTGVWTQVLCIWIRSLLIKKTKLSNKFLIKFLFQP